MKFLLIILVFISFSNLALGRVHCETKQIDNQTPFYLSIDYVDRNQDILEMELKLNQELSSAFGQAELRPNPNLFAPGNIINYATAKDEIFLYKFSLEDQSKVVIEIDAMLVEEVESSLQGSVRLKHVDPKFQVLEEASTEINCTR